MVTSLSLPPFNYFFVNFFTFSLFFLFLIKKSDHHNNKKLFFYYGWLFGFGYFLSNLYWISISLTFDQNFKFLIPLTIFVIPSFLALFYGLITFFFIILKSKKTYIGDIIISYEFINKPKKQKLKLFKDKLTKTFIHGFLHLLNFDHVRNKDYLKMIKEEKKIYRSVISKLN